MDRIGVLFRFTHIEDKPTRPAILKGTKGIAIIELRRVGKDCEYSVVTVFPTKKAHGSIVGQI